MKVHKEGTGLLLSLFTIFFIVNVTLYHTVGKGGLFYAVSFFTSLFFLLVLNFFRSPARRFPFDSEGLVIAPADGTIVAIEEVMARQIAGALDRRIVTYAKVGDKCHVDEQMGFIKFGSRVDVFLPVGTEVLVEMDQKVTGNQTPIARL